jgi:hydroxymethylpyrimidine pyrophosphatase-like HAD family hydrolase
VGTAVGAIFGLLFILGKIYIVDLGYGIVHYLVLSLFVIPVIYTTILLHRGNTSYFSCVVYLSIVVNHLTDENPFLFVWDRSLDTLIGVGVGLLINGISLHYRRNNDTLYVADLDNALRETGDRLTPYSRITIRNLIEDGMPLTIMTSKTPAAYLEALADIRPRIPIIAMDGAILYDIKENAYPKVYVISADHAKRLEKFIADEGFHAFTTVILDDVLMIYYGEPENTAEKKIYEKLHRSPYRNYLKKNRPDGQTVVYFMLIDKTEKINSLRQKLGRSKIAGSLKILVYVSDEYAGYSYMKIYNRNASIENMLDYLQEQTGLKRTVTISDENSRNDVMFTDTDSNRIVRRLSRMYYSNSDFVQNVKLEH